MAKTYKHVGSVPFKIKRSGPKKPSAKKPSPKPPGLPKHIAGRPARNWKNTARAFVKGALMGLGTGTLAGPRIRSAVREAAEEAADQFVKGRRKKPTPK